MRLKLIVAAAALFSSMASAQSMNAEAFLQRATALQQKGLMALFSSDVKLLTKEGRAAGKASAARNRADKAAGRPTRFCAPPGPQKMGSDEFVRRLSAIPRAERARIDMTEATTRIMAAKFPC